MTKSDFEHLEETRMELIRLRNLIRYHRDQKGDDRCWLDDELLYEALPENAPTLLPEKCDFLDKCTRFHARRQAPTKYASNSAYKDAIPDQDAKTMGLEQMKKEIARLHQVIRIHRNVGDNRRTWQDDKRLYEALNEDIDYDSTLPDKETFLTSCSRFFSTRVDSNNLHEW